MIQEDVTARLKSIATDSNLPYPSVIAEVGERKGGTKNGKYYISVDSIALDEDGQSPVAHEIAHVLSMYTNGEYRSLTPRYNEQVTIFKQNLENGAFHLESLKQLSYLLITRSMYEEMVAIYFGLTYGSNLKMTTEAATAELIRIWNRQHVLFANFVNKLREVAQFSPEKLQNSAQNIILKYIAFTHKNARRMGGNLGLILYKFGADQRNLLLQDPEKLVCLYSNFYRKVLQYGDEQLVEAAVIDFYLAVLSLPVVEVHTKDL